MKFATTTLSVFAALASGVRQCHGAICSTCQTLEELYDLDLKVKMPLSGTEAYVAPSQQEMDDFGLIVSDMMSVASYGGVFPGSKICDGIDLRSLNVTYDIGAFNDSDDGLEYCVLATKSASSPWGTVVVNQNIGAKDISFDSVHPLFDSNTGKQSVAVFKGTGARSLIISGSHRHANAELSQCDYGNYQVADAAHVINAFQSASKAVMDRYDALGSDYTAIQFHGMGASTCGGVDAYLTHGNSIAPLADEKIDILRDELEALVNGTFVVPGESGCHLTGGTNVVGRMINGVDPAAAACTIGATTYTGRFIHLEQKAYLREDSLAMHGIWIDAMNNAYARFPNASPPRTITVMGPNNGEPIGQGTLVHITWVSSGVDPAAQLQVSVGTLIDGDYDYTQGIAYGSASNPFAINSDGEEMWRVRTALAPGDNYVVRVRSVAETGIYDYSNTFSVVKPFEITYPNGGETLVAGQTYIITWDIHAVGVGTVKLSLHKDYSWYKNIVILENNTGSYTWTVPTAWERRSDYRIRIRNEDYTSSKDYSDAVFTIE